MNSKVGENSSLPGKQILLNSSLEIMQSVTIAGCFLDLGTVQVKTCNRTKYCSRNELLK